MKLQFWSYFCFIFLAFYWACSGQQKEGVDLKTQAQKIAQEVIILDTHIDVPYRLREKMEDISRKTEKGNFDYPRARVGGLNVPFMSIYIPANREDRGTSKLLADSLIDMVEKFTVDWPDKFVMAYSVADVKRQFGGAKISLAMGMENGAPIEGDLNNLKYFYDRGIRYITLTHAKNNHICDSSYDKERKWKGLSPFGREVVAEMNRLGIMIDVSHVTDSTFYQVMRLSKAPAIASHSSCRHFTPGWERNMSDDMIKLLAQHGGVIQINFGSSFLNDDYRKNFEPMWLYLEEHKMISQERERYVKEYRKDHPIDYAHVEEVAAHIDHVVKLVGIDFVGLGSDFDGVGDSLPTGLKDVAGYPNLIYELLKKGYSRDDIEKICSGNLLRVWGEVENIAQEIALLR